MIDGGETNPKGSRKNAWKLKQVEGHSKNLEKGVRSRPSIENHWKLTEKVNSVKVPRNVLDIVICLYISSVTF